MRTVFWWVLGVAVWLVGHFLVFLKLFYTSVGGGRSQPSEALQLLSLGFGLLTGVTAIVLAGLAIAKRSPKSPWPRRLVRDGVDRHGDVHLEQCTWRLLHHEGDKRVGGRTELGQRSGLQHAYHAGVQVAVPDGAAPRELEPRASVATPSPCRIRRSSRFSPRTPTR